MPVIDEDELPGPRLADELANLGFMIRDTVAAKTPDDAHAIAVLWVAICSALAHTDDDADRLDREFADARALVDKIREGKRELDS